MPHEITFLGILFSPFVPLCLAGAGAAILFSFLLARLNLLRFFVNPPWVIVAFGIIFICLLSAVMWTA